MISKGNKPTASELIWRGIVADFAENSDWLESRFGGYGVNTSQFQLDHFLGAQKHAKINLIKTKIGEFAILAIPISLHERGGNHKLNRTENNAAFKSEFGTAEGLFVDMIEEMKINGIEIPFCDHVLNAIVYG